jgi:geranylgeranyl reductase family protein
MKTDVLIVGAGPGGAYLGYLLAKQGRAVVIVDKEDFPRSKVCGGGISRKTIELLDFGLGDAVQRHIQGAWLCYQNRDMVEASLKGVTGCSVLRSEFDEMILEKARAAGAIFAPRTTFESVNRDSSAIRVKTSKGTYSANYLVGADGVFSRVRKSVFPKNLVTYAPAVEVLVPVDGKTMDSFEDKVLFDFGGMPKGYGWIFPKKDHLNVGVFSMFPQRTIRDDLARFIGMYGSLKGHPGSEVLGHAIPTGNVRELYADDRVFLVGDAAGFAEAFYGEGIYFALKSALLLAEAFMDSPHAGAEASYSRLVKEKLAPDLFYSDLIARLFYPQQRFGYYRMVRNRHCNYYFGELIGGRVSYKECFYKTLATIPYWMLSERIPPSTRSPF